MKLLLSFLFLCLLVSCSIYQKKRLDKNAERQLKCRENWVYLNLKDTTKIKILLFNEKVHTHMTHYPNFIIGIDKFGNILGFIDNITMNKYKIGDSLSLCGYDYNDTSSSNPLKRIVTNGQDFIPVMRVSTKRSYNDLYCTVKKIYYCKIVE